MVENWYRRARTFILEQRQTELKRALLRYPSSTYYCSRKAELEKIEAELETLKEE